MPDGLPGNFLEPLGRFSRPLLVDVTDEESSTLLRAALCGGEADSGTGGRGHEHRLSTKQIVGRDVPGR